MHVALGLIGVVLSFGVFYEFFAVADTSQVGFGAVVVAGEERAKSFTDATIALPKNLSREEVVERIGAVFEYDAEKINHLHDTYRAMQWDAFNEYVVPHLVATYDLAENEREILLTHATEYLSKDHDILESLYIDANYTFTSGDSVLEVSKKLIEPVLGSNPDELVPRLLDATEVEKLLSYVQSKTELLPDLVPLPPQDLGLHFENGRTLLVFTTIYYNQGEGNLEFRADPSTIGTLGDFDREVFQRIYRENGTYRDRSAGTFHWHNEHLHYHFTDFIEYKLESLSDDSVVSESGVLAEKSTFCIRDVSRVFIENQAASPEADYTICGRERQGVSVGWGDAYFSTYADQNLDITNLESGKYRLTFTANPIDRFDEVTKDNNVSSAIILYTKESGTIEVLSTDPEVLPHFEHIHIEQIL